MHKKFRKGIQTNFIFFRRKIYESILNFYKNIEPRVVSMDCGNFFSLDTTFKFLFFKYLIHSRTQ